MERDGTMQPDVTVTFSEQLASVLGFRKVWYPEIKEYTSANVANVDTVNAIYVYCSDSQPVVRVPLVVRESLSGDTRVDYYFLKVSFLFSVCDFPLQLVLNQQ